MDILKIWLGTLRMQYSVMRTNAMMARIKTEQERDQLLKDLTA